MEKRKKAQVPEGVIVLLVIMICVFTLYSIIMFDEISGKAVTAPEKLAEIYNERERYNYTKRT